MSVAKFVITDSSKNIHKPEQALDSAALGIANCSVKVSTLAGGRRAGVQRITVETPKVRIVILPTRGMGIWKAWTAEREFGWQSPTSGPVHPAFVPLMEPGGLGWLDGFDEMLVRCGLESNGAPEFNEKEQLVFPLHGRIANRPAHHVTIEADSDAGTISVIGEVDESRFHFSKLRLVSRTTIHSTQARIEIDDEIQNLSASPGEAQMLYHINMGNPLLDAGSQFIAPYAEIVPRNAHAASGLASWQNYPAGQPGAEEQVYFLKLLADERGDTQTLLKNAHSTAGVSIRHNIKQLPYYSLWKNPTAIEDGYVTGLEPATNFPNPRSYEGSQNRVIKLDGLGKHQLQLSIEFLSDAARVQSVETEIKKLQSQQEPTIFDSPQPGWCADAE